jgi:hypothetical protein
MSCKITDFTDYGDLDIDSNDIGRSGNWFAISGWACHG